MTPHPTSLHKNQAQQLPQHYSVGKQLTINKVTTTKIKQNDKFTRTVIATWEPALKKEKEIPVNWIQHDEVLVGRTV